MGNCYKIKINPVYKLSVFFLFPYTFLGVFIVMLTSLYLIIVLCESFYLPALIASLFGMFISCVVFCIIPYNILRNMILSEICINDDGSMEIKYGMWFSSKIKKPKLKLFSKTISQSSNLIYIKRFGFLYVTKGMIEGDLNNFFHSLGILDVTP